MECIPVIVSNSAYSYLWAPINDLTRGLGNLVILLDDDMGFRFNDNISVMQYDKRLNYSRRLKECIGSIGSEYVLLLHDVDLPLNIDTAMLDRCTGLVDANGIDRLSLGLFNPPDRDGDIQGDPMSLVRLVPRMSPNFYTPFDHAPSIYRRSSLEGLYRQFPDETYFSMEQSEGVQAYAGTRMICFGLRSGQWTRPIYHRGLVYSEHFSFLHITVGGKFMSRETYFDLIPQFEEIVAGYGIRLQASDTRFVKKAELPEN